MIYYSIIIPHKNIPHLLQKCLESIPRREDVQIIVVDDNSDADIVDFKNFPGLNDPFVEVIFGKNENGRKGAGYARNLGLERANGKWLIFADADDFFMPCFNEVLNKYKDDENDIVFFKFTSITSETIKPVFRHLTINFLLEQIQKNNDWDLIYHFHAPWGKFLKRNIIKNNNILFSEIQWGNDSFFIVKTMLISISKKISDDILYCITTREGSLTNQKSLYSSLCRFNEIYRVTVFLKKNGKKFLLSYYLCNLWLSVSNFSIMYSIFLIPKMVKMGLIRFVASHIIKKDIYGIMKVFKKNLYEN